MSLAGLSSCGPRLAPQYGVTGGTAFTQTSITASTSDVIVSGYLCPGTPNVNPYQDNFDEVDAFSVCQQQGNPDNLAISGELSSQSVSQICVFPANYLSSTQVITELNTETGLPSYTCQSVGRGPTFVSFGSITFNAVFIVEGENLQPMIQCLAQADNAECPAYSFGKL